MTTLKKSAATAALLTAFATLVAAQTIERVKMTDNELGCQQIYNENMQMEAVIARASVPAPQPVQIAAVGSPGSDAVAAATQTALAAAVANNAGAFGGLGNFSGLASGAGGIGSMFNGLAQLAQNASAQQAASNGATQQLVAAAQQTQAVMGQQAQARKDHLTGLFLSKNCRMSAIQK